MNITPVPIKGWPLFSFGSKGVSKRECMLACIRTGALVARCTTSHRFLICLPALESLAVLHLYCWLLVHKWIRAGLFCTRTLRAQLRQVSPRHFVPNALALGSLTKMLRTLRVLIKILRTLRSLNKNIKDPRIP